MNVSRRIFLKSGGVAMIGMSTIPAFLQRAVAATPMPNKKKLIVLFQRGAADGLNIVVPFGEENYYRIRRPSRSRSRATAPKAPRSISTDSSACIRASRRSGRCFTMGNWPSFMRPVRPTRRARISTRRISWSPARPA
jgi:hypothetical protein